MTIDLEATERIVLEGLKDFQKATVDRVFELFQSNQLRVLVADEVGLGKTLIAKGVIARTAKLHHSKDDKLFKVIYICSNQSIANQNISKLDITKLNINKQNVIDTKMHQNDNFSDTRLSMQHLKIYEQENDANILEKYIQLIPLTPSTSFYMTSGTGTVEERALMYAIIKRMDIFEDYTDQLDRIFQNYATKSWAWAKKYYESRVEVCNKNSKYKYVEEIIEDIIKLRGNYTYGTVHWVELRQRLLSLCIVSQNQNLDMREANYLIGQLRMVFARVSVDRLEPDLVIMDEFQRFRSLIDAEKDTETKMLADRFLSNNETKVLLLSATPFKLYSTLEEMKTSKKDETEDAHYGEFLQVIKFLFNGENQMTLFRDAWKNYQIQIKEAVFDKSAIVQVKRRAEDAMFAGVCRTERNSVQGSEEIISANVDGRPIEEAALLPTVNDVLSYIEADTITSKVANKGRIPVDYVKSAPYLLSYMREYKLKQKLIKFFKEQPDQIKLADKALLWIKEKDVKQYHELEITNARLNKLQETVFQSQADRMLWIPPSMPYYEPQGVYKNAGDYSKILVFSAWEMVPRMIATLISFEAERRTVGKLIQERHGDDEVNYTSKYPSPRLTFKLQEEKPQAMSLFCLLYPSKTLADVYLPLKHFNDKRPLKEIEGLILTEIRAKLERFKDLAVDQQRYDLRWYFIAPMLMDPQEHILDWFQSIITGLPVVERDTEAESDKGNKGILSHLEKYESYYKRFLNDELEMGKMPRDLEAVLVDQAIASPAVCAYRLYCGDAIRATLYAKKMVNYLNRHESIAAVDLSFRKDSEDVDLIIPTSSGDDTVSEDVYWKNVLTYCKNGNIQAMLDEQAHMLMESNGLIGISESVEKLYQLMSGSLQTHSATFYIDTYKSFHQSITKDKGENRERGLPMRTHFAVAFQSTKSDQAQGIRKESIRNSFNSPFRPFVLATTSIGQEGLDFHYYCRKIMHWNLPSNPVDLEQREGRINRFKCHAIRQNIARAYAGHIQVKKDPWHEIFDYAKQQTPPNQSDLVPFWCLPQLSDGQAPQIKIERIVPMYAMSKDIGQYQRLTEILSLYRLTLGQPRQEELLQQLLDVCDDPKEMHELFINLSPYFRGEGIERENKLTV